MLLDIVILPPSNIRQRIGCLAKKLNKLYPSPSVVDDIKLIPHISLYHLNVQKKNLGELFMIIKNVSTSEKSFYIKTGKLHMGSISIDIPVKAKTICKLNKMVLKKCVALRKGIMPYIFNYEKTAAVKRALANYGTVGTVIDYRPHITLLVNKSGFDDKKIIPFRFKNNFKSSILAVCQINRWYQVTQILKQFKFK